MVPDDIRTVDNLGSWILGEMPTCSARHCILRRVLLNHSLGSCIVCFGAFFLHGGE